MDNVAAGPAVDGERDGGDTPLDAAPAACPRCQQTDFNYEDLDEGTKLVCGDCGYVLDAVVLVHQRTYDEAGGRQDGVRVGETDDGGVTGALLASGTGHRTTGVSNSRYLVLTQNKERLDGGLSYLNLPQGIANSARQLLAQVVDAYGKAVPHMVMSPATVAAVMYVAARQEGRALSLGAAAAALDVAGPDVFREFRRVVQVLEVDVPPPSLETAVICTAARLLPHYVQQQQQQQQQQPGVGGGGEVAPLNGPLRGQPLVQGALQLTQLVQDVGAAEGRSPWVAAAAVWSITLAAHFKDASSKAYAQQVGGHLQHDRHSVQQCITAFDQQLAPLLSLLPYVAASPKGDTAEVGVAVSRHARTLLKLQSLSRSCPE